MATTIVNDTNAVRDDVMVESFEFLDLASSPKLTENATNCDARRCDMNMDGRTVIVV